MSWTEAVHCPACGGTTDWITINGVWTCFHCGHQMTIGDIRDSGMGPMKHLKSCVCTVDIRSGKVLDYACGRAKRLLGPL